MRCHEAAAGYETEKGKKLYKRGWKNKINVGYQLEKGLTKKSMVLNLDDQEDGIPFVRSTRAASTSESHNAEFQNIWGKVYPHTHF